MPSDGVLFTENKLGEGEFDFYNTKLEKVSYPSSMRLKDLITDDYLVTGGIYSSFELRINLKTEKVGFIYFIAGRKSSINLHVSEDEARSIYLNELSKF